MRRWLVMGFASAAMMASAHAEPYPQIVVDRPLVLFSGMTTVDIGVDFPTYRYDASSYTPLGRYKMLDLQVRHGFGSAEILGGFVDNITGPAAILGGAVMIGPGALGGTVSVRLPTASSGLDHEYAEGLGYTIKRIVLPHVLSVDADTFVNADQYAGTVPSSMMAFSAHPIEASAGVGLTVQLVDELALHVVGGIDVPLVDTAGASPSGYAYGALTYVIDRLDIYAAISAGNLPHRPPRPYASVGVALRFGGG